MAFDPLKSAMDATKAAASNSSIPNSAAGATALASGAASTAANAAIGQANAAADAAQAKLDELAKFKAEHGHLRVPSTFPELPNIRQFINTARFQKARGQLSADRQAKLESIGFSWSEAVRDDLHKPRVFLLARRGGNPDDLNHATS
jgi:hypothetical protein